MEPIYWLGLFAILLVIELLTMGLTTIWFAGGSIAAMAASLLGAGIWMQCILFLAVSFLLLIFTRPFAVRYINRGKVPTNVNELLGVDAYVTEKIDNLQGSGKAQVRGQEWTARAADAQKVIAAGKSVKITAIEGVKLIVEEKEGEEKC